MKIIFNMKYQLNFEAGQKAKDEKCPECKHTKGWDKEGFCRECGCNFMHAVRADECQKTLDTVETILRSVIFDMHPVVEKISALRSKKKATFDGTLFAGEKK